MTPTHSNAHTAEVDYICVAGDLLHRIMSELQCVEARNARLTLAMATAGHDLRQRLHSLLGTIELLTLAQHSADSATLAGSAKAKIFLLANELEELARHAESSSVGKSPLKQSFELSPVLDQVQLDWGCEAREKHLGFRIAQTTATVESDPYLLAVIVNNVVANAVRYTQTGEVCIDCAIQDDHLVLEVRDTGPGIPETVLHWTHKGGEVAHTLTDGLGLGLSIVRKTADLLGHRLAFKTGTAEGTRVFLHVPLSRGSSPSLDVFGR